MRIKLYGRLADLAGSESILLEHVPTVAVLKETLIKAYPVLNDQLYIIAVNHIKAGPDSQITSEDTIALLPPFSGG